MTTQLVDETGLLEHSGRLRSLELGATLLLAMLFGYLIYTTSQAGGFHAPNFFWIFIVPFVAALVVGLRAGWSWVGICAATTLAFWWVPELSISVPDSLPAELRSERLLADRLALLLTIGVLLTLFVRARGRSERLLGNAVTELRTQRDLAQLLRDAATSANRATSIEAALDQCVGRVCELTIWSAGRFHVASSGPSFALSPWHVRPGCSPLLAPADALTRRALEERRTLWEPDLAAAGVDAGDPSALGGAVFVPVALGGEVVALLEFRTERATPIDERLLQTLEGVAAQVARLAERARAASQINRLGLFDSLTGLPNRGGFHDALQRAVVAARRHRHSAAVLFVDLDRFKRVNDTFGHNVGDELLRAVADRLSRAVRRGDMLARTAKEAGVLSRVGGDEFTLLLPNVAGGHQAARVAERLLDALALPFTFGGHELFVGASIGIAVFPEDGAETELLIRNADSAMYQAKQRGGQGFRFYDSSISAAASRRIALEGRLHRAIERAELQLHYQPIFEASSTRLTGAEALLRWLDLETGLVSPAEFIPIAEETGLILPIGEWVLRAACDQAVAWRMAGRRPIRMAVNLSGRQLRDPGLARCVASVLSEKGLPPGNLELEITESTIMQDDDPTIDNLRELHELGVCLALDDFGTGYSSISYLRRFELDRLKIDRSFVAGVSHDVADDTLTSAIIGMAHRLGLRVVAEGIETVAQAERLRMHGCDELQGYLLGRPCPTAEFERFAEAPGLLAP